MAVKKVVKADEAKKIETPVTPEVEVTTPVEVTEQQKEGETAVNTNEEEKAVETPDLSVETSSVDGEPEVNVETAGETPTDIPEVEVTALVTPEVEVDTENVKVDTTNKPDGKVKVRMREDHRCYIGQELYDLKEGQCYVIPESVKKRLNKAGLLSPL